MLKSIKNIIAAGVFLGASVSISQAAVVITYQDVGSNLQFDYSGSLDISSTVGGLSTFPHATASAQTGGPVFYSSAGTGEYRFAGEDTSVVHTSGPFATNLPSFNSFQGTSSGTSFLFRLNGGIPGPATSLQLWGDWGAANSPILGQLVLTGQSAAAIGMVDGWNVQTDWGSITFQAAETQVVPVPAAAWLLLSALGGLGFAGWRRKRFEGA